MKNALSKEHFLGKVLFIESNLGYKLLSGESSFFLGGV